MKKILLMTAILFATTASFAQRAAGTFSLQPKVGLTVANFANGTKDADPRLGVVAGLEAEYQLTDMFSLSAGALYSMQGEKVNKDVVNKVDYINVPVLANVYVIPGLAVKLGVQPGFSINSKLGAKIGSVAGELETKAKTVDVSIPVGVSYEISGFVVDARYNWGVTKVFEDLDPKNSVFQVTVGYKFGL